MKTDTSESNESSESNELVFNPKQNQKSVGFCKCNYPLHPALVFISGRHTLPLTRNKTGDLQINPIETVISRAFVYFIRDISYVQLLMGREYSGIKSPQVKSASK